MKRNMFLESLLVKGSVILVIWVVCFIPSYFAAGLWLLVGPESEEARIILGVALGIIMGGSQIIAGIIGAVFTLGVITDDSL